MASKQDSREWFDLTALCSGLDSSDETSLAGSIEVYLHYVRRYPLASGELRIPLVQESGDPLKITVEFVILGIGEKCLTQIYEKRFRDLPREERLNLFFSLPFGYSLTSSEVGYTRRNPTPDWSAIGGDRFARISENSSAQPGSLEGIRISFPLGMEEISSLVEQMKGHPVPDEAVQRFGMFRDKRELSLQDSDLWAKFPDFVRDEQTPLISFFLPMDEQGVSPSLFSDFTQECMELDREKTPEMEQRWDLCFRTTLINLEKLTQIVPSQFTKDDIRKLIRIHSAPYSLDPCLIEAILKAESSYDPKALSRKGARGWMQLMPSTARELGVPDPDDPIDNLKGGIRFFHFLYERYNRSIPLALAAYNAGPGAVDHYGGVPPYPETQDFVRRVQRFHEALKKQNLN